MYCPRCGQQQISDDRKFCSRCGLPFGGLATWVASGGPTEAQFASTSHRRKGIRRGAKLLFLSAVLFPLFLGFSLLIDQPVPLFVPFSIFLAGISIMLYSRIFGEEVRTLTTYQAQQARLGSPVVNNALPAAPSLPIDSIQTHKARTAEIVQPPSVTEHTTKLLDKEE